MILLLTAFSPSLADLQLGSMSLSYAEPKKLATTDPLRKSLGSKPRMRFVGRVGGVAFDGTAKPENGLNPKSIDLGYDHTAPDGQRLLVTLDGKKIKAPLPDWQLKPIVDYVVSKETSCFTLFGKLKNEVMAQRLREREGAHILNYADSFKDTLLGLRLFQLDVLLLDRNFAIDLPKNDGKYFLGQGEKAPELRKGRTRLLAYQFAREGILKNGRDADAGFPTDFQSYVICDEFQEVSIGVEDSELTLSGEPYFYFWKDQVGVEKLYAKLLTEELIKLKVMPAGTAPAQLEREIIRKLEKGGGRGGQLEKDLKQASEAARKRLREAREKGTATYLKEFSEQHSREAGAKLALVNPEVWDAGRQTMRYGAFFRYCRDKHPAAWASFVKEMAAVKLPAPYAGFKTPTVMKPTKE